jgi:hypothetical protein
LKLSIKENKMCLHELLPKEKKQKILDKIPREGLTVYKIVDTYSGKMYPMCKNISIAYETGINEACTNSIIRDRFMSNSAGFSPSYRSGFHFYKTRDAAAKSSFWRKDGEAIIIKCIVKKSWITEIGKEYGRIVLVAKKAIFPKYKGK